MNGSAFPTPVAGEIRQAPKQGTLFQLEELALSHIGMVRENKQKIKLMKEELEEELLKDSGYSSASTEAKESAEDKKTVKDKLMQNPKLADKEGEIKELSRETKELSEGLSDYLGEYKRLSKKNVIKDKEGQEFKIKSKHSV